MPDKARLLAQIENAAEIITPFWPLKTFIAANPLAGFEEMSFDQAVQKGAKLFGGNGLPTRAMGQKALAQGKIKPEILKSVLQKNKAETLWDDMTEGPCFNAPLQQDKPSKLNALLIKYLAAFLDEGQAAWDMPGREKGFFAAWKEIAVYDSALNDRAFIKSLPDTPTAALLQILEGTPDEERETLFQRHLAALPGWSGFVKWRTKNKSYPWQKSYPIALSGLLAVRLAMAHILGEDGLQEHSTAQSREGVYWLQAWEETYRQNLFAKLENTWNKAETERRPDAQFVFCIDVRSEVFRRHLESSGNYETYGFAGFFGVPIRHVSFGEEIAADSCPVLLQPQFETTDVPCCGEEKKAAQLLSGKKTEKGFRQLIKKLKTDIAAPFATVEGTGLVFGLGMVAKTISPSFVWALLSCGKSWFTPRVSFEPTTIKKEGVTHGLSLSERVFHAEAALKIMGLTKNFAPVIFLTGHGGQTENNPYAAGLDCGACGGNHGGPNARVMAAIFNEPAVREGLKERGLVIPEDTTFVGALHNTTTDGTEILGPHAIPQQPLEKIMHDLKRAQALANAERTAKFSTPHAPSTRAVDWAEVRPEWGLARNAAFIVGPRGMTCDLNLEGRTFLHSYDWEIDKDGKALEIILTAPMVVAEWINTQYYFSTVDNGVYGSGSKVTHNVVGKIGVMQGNASDLMTGLPLQSVMSADGELYHEPLRLMTVVKAPLSRVSEIIAENDILQHLFNNEWVGLVVIDPDTGRFMRYNEGRIWKDVKDQSPVSARSITKTETETLELFQS